MIKGLLLALTLMFITATAALIGTNVRYSETFEVKEGEKISEASQISSPSESSKAEESKNPPRFILNEPISEFLNHEDISSSPQSVGEESTSAPPPTPQIPDENKMKKTSEPFLKELYNIKSNAFGNISSLEKKIAVEFLTLPIKEREKNIPVLTEKYLPQVNLIISSADKDVDRCLKKLSAALVAINGDTAIVEAAKNEYHKEKTEKIKYYENILKSFDENISISGETASENPPHEGDTVTSPQSKPAAKPNKADSGL